MAGRDADHERLAHGGPGQMIYQLQTGLAAIEAVDRGAYFELWNPAERRQAREELSRLLVKARALDNRIAGAP